MSQSQVLVVEDDALVRRAYERVLSSEHDVTSVGSGDDALRALQGKQFGAIVSDIDVPGLSGIDLLKAVRSTDMDVPVVLVTGFPSVESAQDAVNYGAFSYLTKPVEPSALRDVVTRALKVQSILALSRESAAANGVHAMGDRASQEVRFENAMATLYMVFQPIVSYARKEVVGYEALLRTEEKSLMRPPDFLDLAERLGRVGELSRKCRDLIAEAIPRAPQGVKIFINLHARDLTDDELCNPKSPLARFAERCVLEVTERASIEGVKDLAQRVQRLRSLGFQLAIDDLGAGYAGLTSLTRLEPEVVKLDMSLVRGVDSSFTKQHLIESMCKVFAELGMMVVTEGVETESECSVLVRLGCDIFQGYLFARPAREFAQPFPAAAASSF